MDNQRLLIHTPLGWFQLEGTETTIHKTYWINEEDAVVGKPSSGTTWKFAAEIQFNEYFNGERKNFDLPVTLLGHPIFDSIYHAIKDIPFGQVMDDTLLAEELGVKVNDVYSALMMNPLLLVIPCHRMKLSSQSPIQYLAGVERHEWLLNHEGVSQSQLSLFG